jgi:predicted GNAT superfamily acetyltransferase
MEKIRIKPLRTRIEYEKCPVIQKEVWGHKDVDLIPVHMICISVEFGAILLGAFRGKELVGFVYSFPAFFEGKLCQHSHLLAVLPQYQGYGIGKKLKWAQREHALNQRYDLITWTVDPLQARNANLNLHTLGAVTRIYYQNFYGFINSLTAGADIPTDRFLMEWWIKEKKIEKRRKKQYLTYDLSKIPVALERIRKDDKSFLPFRPDLSLEQKSILVEIPRNIKEFYHNASISMKWLDSVRRVMTHYFFCGYRAEDFVYGDRCFYLLKKKRFNLLNNLKG